MLWLAVVGCTPATPGVPGPLAEARLGSSASGHQHPGATCLDPPDPLKAELVPIPVEGRCDGAPAMGSLDAYRGVSVTVAAYEPWVRVRRCAVWPSKDLRNVIGTIEGRTRVPAFGPVKHPAFRAGIGYVIPLVDPSGRTCRGYVSQTVLDRIDRYPDDRVGLGLPLPDAEPTWAGPCVRSE